MLKLRIGRVQLVQLVAPSQLKLKIKLFIKLKKIICCSLLWICRQKQECPATWISSRQSRKCVTLLKLMTVLIFFFYFLNTYFRTI